MARPFLDTNVLLYILSDDPLKADRAEALLAAGGTVSVQVLNEFAHVARRKFNAWWPVIRESLSAIAANAVVQPMTLDTHELGLDLAERYRLSVFDGQLLATAQLANCDVFYSEDMHSGPRIGALTLRDPFKPPESF